MPRARKDGNQPTTVAPGQTYGQRKAQEEAQQVAPLPSMEERLSRLRNAGGKVQPIAAPGDPRKPITAGLPVGPGPNSVPQSPAIPSEANYDALFAVDVLPSLMSVHNGGKKLSPSAVRFIKSIRSALPVDFNYLTHITGGDDGGR